MAISSTMERTGAAKAQSPEVSQKAYILYAVWFRNKGGEQQYREWLAAASPIAKDYGARRVEFMVPVEVLRGTFDPDYISVVEFPDYQHFQDFINDDRYAAIRSVREHAVIKMGVLHCRRCSES